MAGNDAASSAKLLLSHVAYGPGPTPWSRTVAFASSSDGRRLVTARISGSQVCILDGQHELAQCLDFWAAFPAVTEDERNAASIRCISVKEGQEPGEVIVLAAIASRLVIWSSASGVSSSSTKGWRIDSSLSLSDDIASIDLHTGRLLVASGSQLQIWNRISAGSGTFWRKTWSTNAPATIQETSFNAIGTMIAAYCVADRYINIWHVAKRGEPKPKKVVALPHSSAVEYMQWRGMPDSSSQSDALISRCRDGTARVWAPVIDEPFKLRLSASIGTQSFGQIPELSYNDDGSQKYDPPVFYLDASAMTASLRSNIELLERDLQLVEAGFGEADGAASKTPQKGSQNQNEMKRTRLKRLQHLLSDTPDMFLRMQSDGSLGVKALANMDRRPPTLLQAFTVLKVVYPWLPPSVELSRVDLIPQSIKLGQRSDDPTATMVFYTRGGQALTADFNPGLFFDGMTKGLVPREAGYVSAHTSQIQQLMDSDDARQVVTIDASGRQIRWNTTRRERAGKGKAVTLGSSCIARSSDKEKHLVVGMTADGPICWSDGLLHFPGHVQALESQASTVLAGVWGAKEQIFALARDGLLYEWSAHGGEPKTTDLSTPDIENGKATCHSEEYELAILTSSGLCKILSRTSASHKWTTSRTIKTSAAKAQVFAYSSNGIIAVVGGNPGSAQRLEIWDSTASKFSSACQFNRTLDSAEGQIVALDWLSVLGTDNILAVGFQHRVEIWARRRRQYYEKSETAASQWAPTATYDLGALTTRCLIGLKWTADSALIAAFENTVLLLGPLVRSQWNAPEPSAAAETEHQVHLMELVAQQYGPLPSYHPGVLLQLLQWSKINVAKRVLLDLSHALSLLGEDEALTATSIPEVTIDELLESDDDEPQPNGAGHKEKPVGHGALFDSGNNSSNHDAGHLDAAFVGRLCEQLGNLQTVALSKAELKELATMARCVLEVSQQRSSLDDCALRYLVALRSFQSSLEKPAGEELQINGAANGSAKPVIVPAMEQARLKHRDIVWAMHSSCQEPLIAHVQSTFANKLPWTTARSTGLFLWLSSSQLPLIAEQVARDQYMASERDPVSCSLFYYALGKHRLMMNLWRQAAWHSEGQKMVKFLDNDFTQQRWKSAACKNAFALMSQRRFEFAASFFMLGDSLNDAVNVCFKNLQDPHLAIALVRIKEGRDDGPILTSLIQNRILPMVFEKGYRWLGHWCFWMLGWRELATRIMVTPLSDFIEILSLPSVSNLATPSTSLASYEDISLAIFYSYLKSKTLRTLQGSLQVSPQREWGFVLHMNRCLARMGCPLIGVALLASWEFTVPHVADAVRRGSTVEFEGPATVTVDATEVKSNKEKPSTPPQSPRRGLSRGHSRTRSITVNGSNTGSYVPSEPADLLSMLDDRSTQPASPPPSRGIPTRRPSMSPTMSHTGLPSSQISTAPSLSTSPPTRPTFLGGTRRRSSLMKHRRASIVNDLASVPSGDGSVLSGSGGSNGSALIEDPVAATAATPRTILEEEQQPTVSSSVPSPAVTAQGDSAAVGLTKEAKTEGEGEELQGNSSAMTTKKKGGVGSLMKASNTRDAKESERQGAQEFDFSNFGF